MNDKENKSIRVTAKNFFTYGISSILGRILSYLMVPMQTYMLAPDYYGLIVELYSFMSVMQIIYSFGIETAYFRFSESNDKYRDFANTFIIIVSILASVMTIILSKEIASVLNIKDIIDICLCVAILIVDAIAVVPFAELRRNNKSKEFVKIKLIQLFINFVLCFAIFINSLFSILYFYDGEIIRLILISNVLSNLTGYIFFRKETKKFNFVVDKNLLKETIGYNVPLLYMSLILIVNDFISRVGVRYWIGEEYYLPYSAEYSVGVFAASQKIATFLSIAIQAYRYSVEPIFFKKSTEKDEIRALMFWFVTVGSLLLLTIAVNADIVAIIFLRREEYREALHCLPIMLLNVLLSGIYYNLSFWFKKNNKNIFGALFATVGCATNFILSYSLIPTYNYLGAVISLSITYILMILLSYFLGQRYEKIDYKPLWLILFLGCSVILSILSTYYWNFEWSIKLIIIKFLISLGIVIGYVVSGFLVFKIFFKKSKRKIDSTERNF